MKTCLTCSAPLPLGSTVRRRYCRGACRQAAFVARGNLRRDLAVELLLRQTAAVIAGDAPTLAAIAEAAARLLPATSTPHAA